MSDESTHCREPVDIEAALDRARAIEREQRDERTRDQHDQTDRISRAISAGRQRTPPPDNDDG